MTPSYASDQRSPTPVAAQAPTALMRASSQSFSPVGSSQSGRSYRANSTTVGQSSARPPKPAQFVQPKTWLKLSMAEKQMVVDLIGTGTAGASLNHKYANVLLKDPNGGNLNVSDDFVRRIRKSGSFSVRERPELVMTRQEKDNANKLLPAALKGPNKDLSQKILLDAGLTANGTRAMTTSEKNEYARTGKPPASTADSA